MDEMGEINPTFTTVYSSLALSECFSAPINPLVLSGNSFSAAQIIASLVGLFRVIFGNELWRAMLVVFV